MKYNELYPSTNDGLFNQMVHGYTPPWGRDQATATTLDTMFLLKYGFKDVSDTFAQLHDQARPVFISMYFNDKWKKYWDLFNLEYNPLDAYTVTQSGSRSLDKDSRDSTTYGKSKSTTSTDTGTVSDISTSTESTDNDIYGFNSVSPTPSNEQNITSDDRNTQTRNLSSTNIQSDSGSDIIQKMESEEENHSLEKRGNIGYHTPQKLIREEFDLWIKPYFDIVLNDINELILVQVY